MIHFLLKSHSKLVHNNKLNQSSILSQPSQKSIKNTNTDTFIQCSMKKFIKPVVTDKERKDAKDDNDTEKIIAKKVNLVDKKKRIYRKKISSSPIKQKSELEKMFEKIRSKKPTEDANDEKVVEKDKIANKNVKVDTKNDEEIENKNDRMKVKLKSVNKMIKNPNVKKAKVVKVAVENDVEVNAKDVKEVEEVKNLVGYFEKTSSEKSPSFSHKPQELKLKFDANVFSSTDSVKGGPFNLKDRRKFDESRAIFSPGKRKFNFSDEISEIGTSQTPKKRRENIV